VGVSLTQRFSPQHRLFFPVIAVVRASFASKAEAGALQLVLYVITVMSIMPNLPVFS
jgi:hypothetical protein